MAKDLLTYFFMVFFFLLSPFHTIKHALYNYIKSLCFMGSYVAVLKYFLCKTKNFRHKMDGKQKKKKKDLNQLMKIRTDFPKNGKHK